MSNGFNGFYFLECLGWLIGYLIDFVFIFGRVNGDIQLRAPGADHIDVVNMPDEGNEQVQLPNPQGNICLASLLNYCLPPQIVSLLLSDRLWRPVPPSQTIYTFH